MTDHGAGGHAGPFPGDGVHVRQASFEDAPEVRRLSLAFGEGMQDVPVAVFDDRYTRILSDDSWCIAVAASEGLLLGYALAQDFRPGLRMPFTTGRLHDLYVDPRARRGGVGSALMDFVFSWVGSRPEPMILDWQARPAAVPFYSTLGLSADWQGDHAEHPGFCLDLRRGQPAR